MYKEAAPTSTPAPTLPVQEQTMQLNDSLFPEIEVEDPTQISTLSESQIVVPIPDSTPSVQISSKMNTSKEVIQVPVKQRKVTKILVMFDDGTFQEM